MELKDYICNNINNFSKNDNIKSNLIKGDLSINDNPLITIAIPTFNRPALLKEAIFSALNQSNDGTEYEIIVVDNDPEMEEITDTKRVIDSFDDEKLLYYKNEANLGMFGNWNRCFELARGKWVALLHDDDLLSDNYIKEISKLIRRKDIVCLASRFEIIDDNSLNNVIKDKNNNASSYLKTMRISKFDSLFWNTNPYGAPTCGALFQRDIVIKEGGFSEEFFPSSDWFFMFKLNNKYKVHRPFNTTGYYRFSVNESLNYKTKYLFVKDIEKFRNYSKDNSLAGKLSYFLFRDEQHAILTEKLVREDASQKITLNSFDDIRIYKNSRIKKIIYKILLISYWKVKIFVQKVNFD